MNMLMEWPWGRCQVRGCAQWLLLMRNFIKEVMEMSLEWWMNGRTVQNAKVGDFYSDMGLGSVDQTR